MSVTITSGFHMAAVIPLDERSVCETVEEMYSLKNKYGGLVTYVKDNNKLYVFKATKPAGEGEDSDSGDWVAIDEGTKYTLELQKGALCLQGTDGKSQSVDGIVTGEVFDDERVIVASVNELTGVRHVKSIDKRGVDLVTASSVMKSGEVITGFGDQAIGASGITSDRLITLHADGRGREGAIPVFDDGTNCVPSDFDAEDIALKSGDSFFADEVPVFDGNRLVQSGVQLGALNEKDEELDRKITEETSGRKQAVSEIWSKIDEIPFGNIALREQGIKENHLVVMESDGKTLCDSGVTVDDLKNTGGGTAYELATDSEIQEIISGVFGA